MGITARQFAKGIARHVWFYIVQGVVTVITLATGGYNTYKPADWPEAKASLELLVVLTLLGVLVASFLTYRDLHRELTKPDTWSAYDFYRDRRNAAIALHTRDVHNFDKAVDLCIDHGILLGEIIATLRAKGHDEEADRVYPYGSPRHVEAYTDEQHTGDFLFSNRRMLTELEGRLTELRDEYASPATQ